MTLKTILACLTSQDSAKSVLMAASALARRHDAHLIGLHTVEALLVYPNIAMHIPETVYAAYGASQTEESAALKAIFEKHTHAEDFVSEWRLLTSESETAADRIVESARCADIVVMASGDTEPESAAHLKLVETVVRDAGRPVVVVPSTFEGVTLGQSVLIGWNGTREAARAAHDVLNVLQDGDVAHILRINDGNHEAKQDSTSSDLAAAFARFGIATTLIQKTWEKPGVGAALNKEAFVQGADLIAIGAYGHSRAYDFVIGAATRDLLKTSKLPVLFSR